MKIWLAVLSVALSINAISQTVCGTAAENGSVTLTAPAGTVFTSVTFASYGTPNGSCGSFTIGSCHATNTRTIVEGALLGRNTATIAANNTVFGDPCNGTVKRLYIEAVYSSTLPLSLTSFSVSSSNNSNRLQWETNNEINTRAFDVERSVDGLRFSTIGSVAASNISGNNLYTYTDNSVPQQVYFYRLKMIDQNGNFTYSQIIKTAGGSIGRLTIFPNPVKNDFSISGLQGKGDLEIITLQGESLKRIAITGNTQTVNMTAYPAGVYILKYTTDNHTFYQRVVKQ